MKLTRSSKRFKAKLTGRNTKRELEIFGRILTLSQQEYRHLGKHDMNVRTNRKIPAHIRCFFFRFRVVLEQGLNVTSTCIQNAKAVAQFLDQDKNDVGIFEESINPERA